MKIGDLDIPNELLIAQKEGKLAIFAGAGVSMPSPSNYPDFPKLADDIARGTGLKRLKDEPIDHFLGRLENAKVLVHKRVQEELSIPNPHNHLHEHVLQIFTSSSEVRLITTNFDTYFDSAVKSLYSTNQDLIKYHAPALPVGRSFSGIIYIHGCVTQSPDNLILTDKDFGRAYLTEGWARRFLTGVFSNYVVLFIGYSHNDSVLNYLARALVPDESKRYAITPNGDNDRWKYLGIEPITYELDSRTGKEHQRLYCSLERFVAFTGSGYIDSEKRIREIAKSIPPESREDEDFIKWSLSEPETTQFFTENATSPKWINWLDKNNHLDLLFDPTQKFDDVTNLLSNWISRVFVFDECADLFNLIYSHSNKLNSGFIWHLMHETRFQKEKGKINSKTFSRWIILFIENVSEQHLKKELSDLLRYCKYPEDAEASLILFDFLTEPHINLGEVVKSSKEGDLTYFKSDEIKIDGDNYSLLDVWDGYLSKIIELFSERLIKLSEKHIERGYNLLFILGRASEDWDPISYSRSAIEDHEQDKGYGELDILITVARDSLEYLIEKKPSYAENIIENWIGSRPTVFRRLAIHGIRKHNGYGADEKIEMLFEYDWLYNEAFHHEVFQLLKDTYPIASEEIREYLVDDVMKGPYYNPKDEQGLQMRVNSIHRLLKWLLDAKPDCEYLIENEALLLENYPFLKKIESQEYPDLTHWMHSGFGYDSPISVEEMLAKSPEDDDFLEFLITHTGREFDEGGRRGIISTLQGVVFKSFDWGLRLLEKLRVDKRWDVDLWRVVLAGLIPYDKSSMNEHRWSSILTLIIDNCEIMTSPNIDYTLSDLLERGVRSDDKGIPIKLLYLAETIADKIADTWSTEQTFESGSNHGWLNVAINQSGGKIGEFWMRVLKIRYDAKSDDQPNLLDRYKRYLEKILEGKSSDAKMASVIFFSRLGWLFALDNDWTKNKMIPFFDWNRSKIDAEQAWDAFLFSSRLNYDLIEQLLPYFTLTFGYLEEMPQQFRSHFNQMIAIIWIHARDRVNDDEWLDKYLNVTDVESRSSLIREFGKSMGYTFQDKKEEKWNDFLKPYWEKRINNIPVAVSEEEKAIVFEWLPHMTVIFPKVVEIIVKMEISEENYQAYQHRFGHVYRNMEKLKWYDHFPVDFITLLDYCLKHDQVPFWHGKDVIKMVRSVLSKGDLGDISKDKLRNICHNLLRLRELNASDLWLDIEAKYGVEDNFDLD
jgi:hypothetical protein